MTDEALRTFRIGKMFGCSMWLGEGVTGALRRFRFRHTAATIVREVAVVWQQRRVGTVGIDRGVVVLSAGSRGVVLRGKCLFAVGICSSIR